MTYRLADLEKITQANRRAVQVWAEAGALEACRGTHRVGTGKPREFEESEAIVACLLSQFARHSVSIGGLIKLGRQFREILHDAQVVLQFERAKADKGRNFLLVNGLDGYGRLVVLSDAVTPTVDLFKMLAGVTNPTDDIVTHVIDLNRAFEGFRL